MIEFSMLSEAHDNIANINNGLEERARNGGSGKSRGKKGRAGLLGDLIPFLGAQLETYLHKFWNDLTDVVIGYFGLGLLVTIVCVVVSLIVVPCTSGGINSQAGCKLFRFPKYAWRNIRSNLNAT